MRGRGEGVGEVGEGDAVPCVHAVGALVVPERCDRLHLVNNTRSTEQQSNRATGRVVAVVEQQRKLKK